MRLKDIDNPWLVVRLPLMLGTFGAIAGTALAPLLVQVFSPNVNDTVDAYSQHHANWYWIGAGAGLAIGLILAIGTLLVLKKHEEEEANAGGPEPHAAH